MQVIGADVGGTNTDAVPNSVGFRLSDEADRASVHGAEAGVSPAWGRCRRWQLSATPCRPAL